jgi:hypothetical protein
MGAIVCAELPNEGKRMYSHMWGKRRCMTVF